MCRQESLKLCFLLSWWARPWSTQTLHRWQGVIWWGCGSSYCCFETLCWWRHCPWEDEGYLHLSSFTGQQWKESSRCLLSLSTVSGHTRTGKTSSLVESLKYPMQHAVSLITPFYALYFFITDRTRFQAPVWWGHCQQILGKVAHQFQSKSYKRKPWTGAHHRALGINAQCWVSCWSWEWYDWNCF